MHPDGRTTWKRRLLRTAGGFVLWLVSGYIVLFAANGGAAGSAEVTTFAWACLAVYTLIFIALFSHFTHR